MAKYVEATEKFGTFDMFFLSKSSPAYTPIWLSYLGYKDGPMKLLVSASPFWVD